MASKTRRLELAKAAAAVSSIPLPREWLPSVVMSPILASYATEGLLPAKGWRPPELGEVEPHLLDMGLWLPIHPFVRDWFKFYGAQLHHAPPNGIAHLACFISLCENFLGTEPHWRCGSTFFLQKHRWSKRFNHNTPACYSSVEDLGCN